MYAAISDRTRIRDGTTKERETGSSHSYQICERFGRENQACWNKYDYPVPRTRRLTNADVRPPSPSPPKNERLICFHALERNSFSTLFQGNFLRKSKGTFFYVLVCVTKLHAYFSCVVSHWHFKLKQKLIIPFRFSAGTVTIVGERFILGCVQGAMLN